MNIEIIKQDWEKLAGRRHRFSADFYRRLFERHPRFRPLFPDDVGPQGERMVEMLSHVTRFADHIDLIRPYLVSVGFAHRRLNISEKDVEDFVETLLDTLSDACGGFDQNHTQAWREVLDDIIAPLFDDGLETGRSHKTTLPSD